MAKKEEYVELLNQCLEEECDCNHWCLLKEIVIAGYKFDPRTLVQFKCVEKYKDERSKAIGQDIGWETAWNEWHELNYDVVFAKVYTEHPKIKPQHLYNKIITH